MSDTQLFELDPAFLSKFNGKQPKWGPFGYITYKRTYARKLDNGTFEEFWQTLKRVVEGTYRIQQKHCAGLRLPWSNVKAQHSAQEMYIRMWEFKFLPPGRGLWAMGTSIVDRLGSAPLNNCSFVSTADLKTSFSAPFCFLMDMSMLGVGVGGDTRGAGSITIKRPFLTKDVYVVPDTREGWVDLVRVMLDSYVRETAQPEQVDYSQVRPAGTSINGFGGTASGPAPLIELVQSIKDILNPLTGQKITSTAIVDLFNVIGRCVVAGNVRRSAEIMFGDPNDVSFLELKDPDKHATELKHHRWASNNSIYATVGMDYTEVAKRTATNGEPGLFWLDNARAFSRMGHPADWRDEKAVGSNPCQPAQALVLTPDGIRTFGDIDKGSTIWSGTKWTKVVNKWCTGIKKVYEYRTTAGYFLGTANHKVISHGNRVEAQNAIDMDIVKGNLIAGDNFDLQTVVDGLALGEDLEYVDNRRIPTRFKTGTEKTVRSFLRGLYTAVGSVEDQQITIKTVASTLRDDIQAMLSALGIGSHYTTHKSTAGKESYDLNIDIDCELFYRFIGFTQLHKMIKLKAVVESTQKTKREAKSNYEIKSVVYVGDEEVFDITVEDAAHTYWTNGCLVSNCSEQTLEAYELCNLVETFPARHDSVDDYKRTLKFAYLYAKTVTLIPTHDVRANAVMMRNRRIGTSQSGIIQAINKFGLRAYFNLCDEGYAYLAKTDKVYSNWLCVPESIKKTSVKPSGTVSLLPGATPGMHYPHSEYYIRNIRCEKGSKLVNILEKAGYHVEDDFYTPNTSVVSVPVHEVHYAKGKSDITMWEQLELTAQIQHHWADNQVSVTVTFNPSEAKDIQRALEFYETRLKSVSFLPVDGGGYKQAPYTEIDKDTYEKLAAKLKPYDLATITHDTTDAFCDGDKCIMPSKTVA
jgi:ribonucleotide reductase alpha subunit